MTGGNVCQRKGLRILILSTNITNEFLYRRINYLIINLARFEIDNKAMYES